MSKNHKKNIQLYNNKKIILSPKNSVDKLKYNFLFPKKNQLINSNRFKNHPKTQLVNSKLGGLQTGPTAER